MQGGIIVMMTIGAVIMMVGVYCCHSRQAMVVRSARHFDNGGHSLHREGGNYQPKQYCLEDATHIFSLARARATKGESVSRMRSHYQTSHDGKVKGWRVRKESAAAQRQWGFARDFWLLPTIAGTKSSSHSRGKELLDKYRHVSALSSHVRFKRSFDRNCKPLISFHLKALFTAWQDEVLLFAGIVRRDYLVE